MFTPLFLSLRPSLFVVAGATAEPGADGRLLGKRSRQGSPRGRAARESIAVARAWSLILLGALIASALRPRGGRSRTS